MCPPLAFIKNTFGCGVDERVRGRFGQNSILSEVAASLLELRELTHRTSVKSYYKAVRGLVPLSVCLHCVCRVRIGDGDENVCLRGSGWCVILTKLVLLNGRY